MDNNMNMQKENDPVFQKYREFVQQLESTKDEDLRTRLDHATDGLVTEAGELKGLMKKIKFLNGSIPKIRFLDEMGDALWYLVLAMNVLEVTFEDLMRLNTTKLKARYPSGKFSSECALNKDTEKEQKEMEKEI